MRVKYYSSPLGEGKGGSRYIIFRELYYPLQWGHGLGTPGPQTLDVTEQVWGLRWGEQEGKGFLGKKDQYGVLGSGCLGLSILPLLSDVLCRLVFFFFFLIEIRAGAGEHGKDLGMGCSHVWGQSWETLPATGLAQSPMASF